MATEKSLSAIELVHRAYTKLADMPSGEQRNSLGLLANDAYATAMMLWRDEKLVLEPQQAASLANLRKAMGEEEE